MNKKMSGRMGQMDGDGVKRAVEERELLGKKPEFKQFQRDLSAFQSELSAFQREFLAFQRELSRVQLELSPFEPEFLRLEWLDRR